MLQNNNGKFQKLIGKYPFIKLREKKQQLSIAWKAETATYMGFTTSMFINFLEIQKITPSNWSNGNARVYLWSGRFEVQVSDSSNRTKCSSQTQGREDGFN